MKKKQPQTTNDSDVKWFEIRKKITSHGAYTNKLSKINFGFFH